MKNSNSNLNIKQIMTYAYGAAGFLKKHAPIIFIVIVLGIYSFLIFQINQMSTVDPSPEQIAEKQNLIQRLKIDQEAVDKIQQLEDQNVSVRSLFKAARDNPFQDN